MLATVRLSLKRRTGRRSTSVVLDLAVDMFGPMAALVAENAVLHQQSIALQRRVKRPPLNGRTASRCGVLDDDGKGGGPLPLGQRDTTRRRGRVFGCAAAVRCQADR
jgi:hypothetical protein